MIVMPDLSKVMCVGKYCSRYSYVLLLIIPAIIILFFLIRKNFVKFMNKNEQAEYEKERKNLRNISLVTRTLVFVLVIIAISAPFIMEGKLVKGNPRLTILTDESNSFGFFDKNTANDLYSKIKGKVPVELRTIGSSEDSAIGNGILNNLEGGENIMVITDGNNNRGKLLGDVIMLASSMNSTVSTLQLDTQKSDVSIEITGPGEVITDTMGSFNAVVNNAGKKLSYTLEIKIDNDIIYSKKHTGSVTVPFNKVFSSSEFHKITAKLAGISGDDYFPVNNVYYKAVKIVQRPAILFVSKKSSLLKNEFQKLYDVTTKTSIPNNLNEYMAVVLNDLHASEIIPQANALQDYVSDKGNGLFVIGGQNSFDRGGYKGTILESMLPVKIGAGEENEESDVNVVVIVDVSGSSTEVYNQQTGKVEVRDYDRVIKALAVSVLDSLDKSINVGVVAVGTKKNPYVGTVSDIVNLKKNKKDLEDKIARISGGGQSPVADGLKVATKLLMKSGGGKNIILISDGRGIYSGGMEEAKSAALQGSLRGIKTYVVGVGTKERQETDFLSGVASKGNGIYFPANGDNRLKLLFGEPDKSEKDLYNKLAVLDSTHFITRDIEELESVISGYNYIVPKASARHLVSTNKKIPILAAWRFGLGRIAVLGTDDGGKWAGEMLSKSDSMVITRSVNWAIGNLGRKKSYDVSIRDTTIGKETQAVVISTDLPKEEGLKFSKIDVNTYSAIIKTDESGFFNRAGADYAVNYNTEYKKIGMNDEFMSLVNSTGGKVFDKEDIDNIIDFVIENSRRIKLESTDFIWPFALLALIIFIGDIFIRKLYENKIFK